MHQVILLTGASSGFGLLSSIELARMGHRVFASMRDPSKKAPLERAAADAKVSLEVIALDVTRQSSIEAATAEVEARAGRIDVLVNNAGYGIGGCLEDLDMSELREQLETNFLGAVALMKAVIPQMRERGSGRIVNVSSIGGQFSSPGLSAYCASKWALEGLSESLRHELRELGIAVVLVEPGSFKTEIFAGNRRMAKRAHDSSSPNFQRTKRLEAMVEKMLAANTADPMAVARTIAKAATVPNPRLRYLVGRDAQAQALLKRFLPFSLIERAVDRRLGVK